jgi:hypothetical protein
MKQKTELPITEPYKMKHLWRRRNKGRARYKLCATSADEPEMKLIVHQSTRRAQPFDEDLFNSQNAPR